MNEVPPASSVRFNRTAFGAEIESRALAWWLERHPDSRLLDRNFRCKMGEIDLVMQVGVELVFVEVRAREAGGWVDGIESVTWIKRQRITRAARVWLARNEARRRLLARDPASAIRFDVLAWDGAGFTHLARAWD